MKNDNFLFDVKVLGVLSILFDGYLDIEPKLVTKTLLLYPFHNTFTLKGKYIFYILSYLPFTNTFKYHEIITNHRCCKNTKGYGKQKFTTFAINC